MIQSDLALAGLQARSGNAHAPDLSMEFAAVPDWAADALRQPVTSVRVRPSEVMPGEPTFTITEFSNGQFALLTYGDATRFLIDGLATRLWGEPGSGLTHEDLCVYLLGPVMGYVLRKRGGSPLHASAVSIEQRAIAFVGESGAGKSTTAATLALRGWPVLCEDVCALDEALGSFNVIPGYPRVQLWPDSVEILMNSPTALPLIVDGWEKRFLPLDGRRAAFAEESSPLTTIFFLAPRENHAGLPRIQALSPREACLNLVQDTYMNWMLDSRQRAVEFDFLTRLVGTVECFRLIPSSDRKRLPQLGDLIESHMAQTMATDRRQETHFAS